MRAGVADRHGDRRPRSRAQDALYLPEAGRPANEVYLTGPYEGAPFGLSVVVPALAGPFDLGTVVMRAKVAVDPHTAQLTVTSDPLPAIEEGVPLDIRTIDVTVDRPDFILTRPAARR